MTSLTTLAPAISTATPSLVASALAAKSDPKVKARAAATNFEQVFLNSMFSQMFAGLDGDGPMGGGGAVGVWRSFLTDEYAKTVAKQGGIGIADQVYRTLLGQQEVTSTAK